jgi:DnaJ-class molecular chaperone
MSTTYQETGMEEDYYQVLGVSRSATQPEIEKAYHKLARKYHPDLNPDDQSAKAKFQQVQRAYDVLRNPELRTKYDRYGSDFEQATTAGWAPGGGGGGGRRAAPDFDPADIFRGFTGGGESGGGFEQIFRQFGGAGAARGAHRPAARGADVSAEIEIPFTTSILGGETAFILSRGGRSETVTVKIPAGIESGKKIRLRGQGQATVRDDKPGDLLLTVHVMPHPCFRRRGHDLEVDVPVTLAEAQLGGKVDVPTPSGTITLKIPPGTSSGRRLRIKGQGVKTASGEKGDLFAQVQIVIPPEVDEETAEQVRAMERRYPLSPRRTLRW